MCVCVCVYLSACVGVFDCQSERSEAFHMPDCSNFLSLFFLTLTRNHGEAL